MCLDCPFFRKAFMQRALRLVLALNNMCEKRPYIYVILLVPGQPLLTQYPVSERASLQHVALGLPPNRTSMKITHPVAACSSLKAISLPPDRPRRGCRARSAWQSELHPATTKPLASPHPPPILPLFLPLFLPPHTPTRSF